MKRPGRSHKLIGSDRLPDHLAEVLVVSHALEGWLAKGPLVGPLRPGDLADQLRFAPHRKARLRTGGAPDIERAVWPLALVKLLRQEVDLLLVQAGADAAGEAEGLLLAALQLRASLVVVADQQRAHPLGAPPLAGDVATDHELLAPPHAGLDPLAGSLARPVGALAAFCDDPLQSLPAGRLEQVGAAVVAVPRRPPARSVEAEPLQQLAARQVGQVPHAVPVEVEQIED